VPVVMRSRINEVMQKEFAPIPADADVQSVVEQFPLENMDALPVVDKDGKLLGILAARDLLKWRDPAKDHDHRLARERARQDYVVAHPTQTVDAVTRAMLLRNVEHVVVTQTGAPANPIGVARAADILKLRRWVMEQDSHEQN